MNTKTLKRCLLLFVLLCLGQLHCLLHAQNERVTITGYGEINYISTMGASPDKEAAELYEEYGLVKEYSEPRNDMLFPGIGLVFSANMQDEKLTFLSELNFRTNFDKIELGIERCYLNYFINNKLQIQTGIYSAPIGALNVIERNHGYLSNSIRIRDMVNLDYGYIPTRIFGAKAYGTFETGELSSINYVFSIGSGRGLTPIQSPYEIDLFEENESSLSLSGGVEYVLFAGDGELKLGLSGFIVPKLTTAYIPELGGEADIEELDELLEGEEEEEHTPETPAEEEAEVSALQMKELGIAPYVRYQNNKFEFYAELHKTVMIGLSEEVEDQKFHYTGLSTEFAYKTKLRNKKFVPYIRYDYTKLPENGGFYYGLRSEGDMMKRHLMADNSMLMIGASWNVFTFNKIKIEYNHALDGPQPKHAILLQTAFVF